MSQSPKLLLIDTKITLGELYDLDRIFTHPRMIGREFAYCLGPQLLEILAERDYPARSDRAGELVTIRILRAEFDLIKRVIEILAEENPSELTERALAVAELIAPIVSPFDPRAGN